MLPLFRAEPEKQMLKLVRRCPVRVLNIGYFGSDLITLLSQLFTTDEGGQ